MQQHPPHSRALPRLRGALGLLGLTVGLLSGCDYLGVESASQLAEQKAAEGKAIGGACRHANRALEDCYTLNPKANKAAVFDGWRDMDAYMRENNLPVIAPVMPSPNAPKKPKEAAAEDDAADAPEEKKPAPAKK